MTALSIFTRSYAHRYLHSFPTRRSSDLHFRDAAFVDIADHAPRLFPFDKDLNHLVVLEDCHTSLVCRSEEHTSELQSLAYLVCRLLLEKKKRCDKRRRFQELHTLTQKHQ